MDKAVKFSYPLGWALSVALLLFNCKCSFNTATQMFEQAESSLKNKEHESALDLYERVIKRSEDNDLSVKAAKQGARVAQYETKEFQKALYFLKFIIINSGSQTERMDAQKRLANIYFENIADYESAIHHFNRLLEVSNLPDEKKKYRFSIAKAYFYLHQFFQAASEIELLLQEDLGREVQFEALRLKADILVSTKKKEEAVAIYKKLLETHPERARKENIALHLAVCYEELEKYDQTIELLEGLKESYPNPEFIELKIRRIKERRKILPGAKGLKK